MIEVRNKFYIQRFFAKELPVSDFFKSVTYTEYKGDKQKIPFWYKQIHANTGIQDLTKDLGQILQQFKSNTRNEVRRAEKEGCVFETSVDFDTFLPFYNNFAIEKGLPCITMGELSKYDKIIITSAKHDGVVLAMHATLFSSSDKSATLMYSCSPRLEDGVDRKFIGWGNRFLHYKDFDFFKSLGAERYEWNGINMNPETPERYSIGQFKLGFGCEPVECINLQTPFFVLLHFIRFRILKFV